MKKISLFTLLASTLFARTLLAHPGHGNPQMADSWMHYLVEPYHYLPVIVGGFLIATVLYYWRSSRSRNR